MTERGELISLLESLSEEKFRVFNEKIVHTSKYRVIGVRMPDLKAIAKGHKADYKKIFELPYDSFEEIIIKGCLLYTSNRRIRRIWFHSILILTTER